jgi:hypothetical protein
VGLCHAAALLTKQTAWPLSATIFLICSFRGQWNKLFFFGLGAWIPPALVVGFFEWITHGMFLNHTFFWSVGTFDFSVFRQLFLGSWIKECGLLFLLALIVLKWGTRQTNIVLVLFCFQTVSLISLGRILSAENYYLEFFLITAVVIAEGLRVVSPKGQPLWLHTISTCVVLIVSISFALGMGFPSVPSPSDINSKQQAASIMTGRGPVLALDPDLVLMTGRNLWYQPSSFAFLYRLNKWDSLGLVKSIQNRELEWIEIYDLPQQPLLPPPIENAILKYYVPVLKRWGRVFMRPRPKDTKGNDNPQAPFPAPLLH